jgi:hypothetical protein
MDKKRIINYILAIIIMLTIPLITFVVLNLYLISIGESTLAQINYVIAAITGLSTIYFWITMDVLLSKAHKTIKIIFLVLMFTSPLIGYYGFGSISAYPTTEQFARAMFGYIFGVSIGAGYKLMKPRKS